MHTSGPEDSREPRVARVPSLDQSLGDEDEALCEPSLDQSLGDGDAPCEPAVSPETRALSQELRPEPSIGVAARALIIGAGASGLVAAKEFAAAGFDPLVIEAGDALGGVYRTSYERMQLTSSSVMTAFSDFPGREARPKNWLASEYLAYLREYAEAHDVLRRVRFHTSVDIMRRREVDGTLVWSLGLRDVRSGAKSTVEGAVVVVCTGSNAEPSRPQFEGQEDFSGEVVHTADVSGFARFAGKRVLCLGIGESGSDLPLLIAQQAPPQPRPPAQPPTPPLTPLPPARPAPPTHTHTQTHTHTHTHTPHTRRLPRSRAPP